MGLTSILLAEQEARERKLRPEPPPPPPPLDQQLKAAKNEIVRLQQLLKAIDPDRVATLEAELAGARRRIAQLEADVAELLTPDEPMTAEVKPVAPLPDPPQARKRR